MWTSPSTPAAGGTRGYPPRGFGTRRSLDDLAAVLDDRFLHTRAAAQKVLAAYAHDHGSR
ncbi:hypothetical protein [Streptomyces sp. NPDC050164]|uniref:hypothetical protein n=1 Tax=Streptomyces sp. NPDC050164 TaxID=3365605 RepID=UPI0037BA1EFE